MIDLKLALRAICQSYELEPVAVYRRGSSTGWPLQATDEDDLQQKLASGGHFLPLPKEPAALANILESSVRAHVMQKLHDLHGLSSRVGTERGYPDVEVTGPAVGDLFYAVDIKVARRKPTKNGLPATKTQSRITLYTGNTYFRYPEIHWPGTFRAFQDYSQHLDIVVLYNLSDTNHRVEDIELLVCEPWEIGSKQRSSTTREYLGAVDGLRELRAMKGEFATPEEFYAFWRKFPFKTGKAVENQLRKLMASNKAAQLKKP